MKNFKRFDKMFLNFPGILTYYRLRQTFQKSDDWQRGLWAKKEEGIFSIYPPEPGIGRIDYAGRIIRIVNIPAEGLPDLDIRCSPSTIWYQEEEFFPREKLSQEAIRTELLLRGPEKSFRTMWLNYRYLYDQPAYQAGKAKKWNEVLKSDTEGKIPEKKHTIELLNKALERLPQDELAALGINTPVTEPFDGNLLDRFMPNGPLPERFVTRSIALSCTVLEGLTEFKLSWKRPWAADHELVHQIFSKWPNRATQHIRALLRYRLTLPETAKGSLTVYPDRNPNLLNDITEAWNELDCYRLVIWELQPFFESASCMLTEGEQAYLIPA